MKTKIVLLGIGIASILSSCCPLDRLELDPSIGLRDGGAKSGLGSVETVGFGLVFKFQDWCPSDETIARLKKLEDQIDANLEEFENSDRTAADEAKYRRSEKLYQERIANVIANAQAIAKRPGNGNTPSTAISEKKTDKTNVSGNPETTVVEQKGTAKQQESQIKKAIEETTEKAL